jgi:adenine/guanine phosphoribosyltransferase-like PRPP-binding protein
MISIDFEISKDGYTFKDAIVLPEDHGLTDDQIEAMKQKRFDDWYKIITAPEDEIVS